jgi:hypothetical protein
MKNVNFGLILLGVGAVLCLLFIPNQLLQGAAVATIVFTGLFAALLKHLQDEAGLQREILKAEQQQRFLVGASSHMATTAFNKHVEFCEAYVKEVHLTLGTLFQQGATPDALNHDAALAKIRRDYIVWLTPAIEAKLDVFQDALREVGIAAGYVQSMSGGPIAAEDGPYHMQQIHKMHKREREVIGLDTWNGETLTKEAAVSTVITRLRDILETTALTELRSSIVRKAMEKVEQAT